MITNIGERRVKARKPHGCFLCTVPIAVGVQVAEGNL